MQMLHCVLFREVTPRAAPALNNGMSTTRLQAILKGSMLMRGGGGDSVSAGGWVPAQVVLTERAVLWLQPPSSTWHAAILSHAQPQSDSSPQPLAEVFELSTARHTLRFRCRSRDVAERWFAALTLACETQSDSTIAEMAELLNVDYTESSLQWRLLDAAAGGRAPTAHRLLSLSRATRIPLSAATGGGSTALEMRGGGLSAGGVPVLLPAPRGRFDVLTASLPSEGVVAAAVGAAVRASRAGGSSVASSAAATALVGRSRWRPLRTHAASAAAASAVGHTRGNDSTTATMTTTTGTVARARLRQTFGGRAVMLLLAPCKAGGNTSGEAPSPTVQRASSHARIVDGSPGAAISVSAGARAARRRFPASAVATLPAELVAPVRATLAASLVASGGGPITDTVADAALRRALTGPVPLLLEALALCGAEPALLKRAMDAAAARGLAREALSTAQMLAGRRPRATAAAAPAPLVTRSRLAAQLGGIRSGLQPGHSVGVGSRAASLFVLTNSARGSPDVGVGGGAPHFAGARGGRGVTGPPLAFSPVGSSTDGGGGFVFDLNSVDSSSGGGGIHDAASRSFGTDALSSTQVSARGSAEAPLRGATADLDAADEGDADVDVASLADFLAVGVAPAKPVASSQLADASGEGHAPSPQRHLRIARPPHADSGVTSQATDDMNSHATGDRVRQDAGGSLRRSGSHLSAGAAERGVTAAHGSHGATSALAVSISSGRDAAVAGAHAAAAQDRVTTGRLSDDDRSANVGPPATTELSLLLPEL